MVLFSNGAEYRVLKELAYVGIEDYFEMIVSAQDLKALKPNPLGLEVIIKALRAKKERAIYIGDMTTDIAMAKYAGISSCAVSCGFDSYIKLKSTHPDYIFRSIEELKKAL